MKKLIVSGCSWGDPHFLSAQHPTMDTDWPKWPEILAEKLNMEPVNLCKSGMGNEYIYSSLSDYLTEIDTDKVGHVLAAWSSAPRRDFELTNTFGSESKNEIKHDVTRWNNIRTDSKGDLRYWIKKSIRYQFAFQNLMQHYKTKVADQALFYNQFQMISLIKGHIWEIINAVDYSSLNENDLQARLYKFQKFAELHKQGTDYVRKTLNKEFVKTIKQSKYKFNDTFLGWPPDDRLGGYSMEDFLPNEYRISEYDRHPNAKGQEKIAEVLYDRMG